GSTGELRDRPAFDLISQASSGIMHALDMQDRPPPIFFGDLISGAYAAMGISFALFSREKTGQGQRVDISMQDVMYYHQFQAMSIRALGESADDTAGILGRSMHNLLTNREDPLPFWNSYRAQDGFVGVAALTDSQWRRMMKAIGRDDLADDPRFSNFITRVHNSRAGVKIIAQWAAARSCDEIVQALSEQRVPCAKVISTEEVNEDPQLKERGMLAQVEHASLGTIGVPGSVFKMSLTPGEVSTAHPGLGEHTEEVLKELLGLDDARIAELEAKGAI
ncbi:MAG: CoA transferase, partial [Pseudomonadota bacterium]